MIAPVRPDPADIVALDFAGRTRTPVSALRRVKKPDAEDLTRASSHVRGGDSAARTIELACQAAADGSIICVAAEGAASESAAAR